MPPRGQSNFFNAREDKTNISNRERERLVKLAYWLDEWLRIPGTNWRLGLDGLVGLIPGIGDGITTMLAAYIVFEARRLGVPKVMLVRMIRNIVIDGLIGTIPLVGDLFDFRWKANRKNILMLNEHLAKHPKVEMIDRS
ncbi:MAG: DUF4112 domain-containing protein [Candidatus Nitrosoglobus sp.]|jgi:hypothetical protein